MQNAAIVTFVYAVLIAAGGVIGGVKAGSTPSLVAGIASGLLAALAGVLLLKGQRAGLWLGLAVALALLLFGAKSVVLDGKGFMPRGLIAVLSLVEGVVLALAMRTPR